MPVTFVCSYSLHGPVTPTFAARCTTASWPSHAAGDRVAVGDRAEHLAGIGARRAPLERRDLVTTGDQPLDRVPADQAGRTGDEHPHSDRTLPPASTSAAQRGDVRAIDLRVVPPVDGQRRHLEHGDHVAIDRGPDRIGEVERRRSRRRRRQLGLHHGHELLDTARADADHGGGRDDGIDSIASSSRTGATGPSTVVIT